MVRCFSTLAILILVVGKAYTATALHTELRVANRKPNRGSIGVSHHGYKDGRTNRGKRYSAGGVANLKPKDLCMIPARVAMALQADGWYLRQDIIWHKPNPMPEPVTDRCTKAHEYIFLLSKSVRYYYDAEAVREPTSNDGSPMKTPAGWDTGSGSHGTIHRNGRSKGEPVTGVINGRNLRSVWTVTTQPFKAAHFATFPPKLIEPCVKAGCPEGGIVLDPFGGAGTTGLVAQRLGRNFILIELNTEYAEMARNRIYGDASLFSAVQIQESSRHETEDHLEYMAGKET